MFTLEAVETFLNYLLALFLENDEEIINNNFMHHTNILIIHILFSVVYLFSSIYPTKGIQINLFKVLSVTDDYSKCDD